VDNYYFISSDKMILDYYETELNNYSKEMEALDLIKVNIIFP